MSTSSGWLLQRVRIRNLRHHLHLRRHGKLSWPTPTPTLRWFYNSCKSETKEIKAMATIRISLLHSTSSSQTSQRPSVTVSTDADDWLVDICKHFECSNVRPEDFVKFASFQLKDQAAEWYQQYKDSRGGRVITWDEFCQDFKAHHIPQSVVESKREEFRNLKQGSLSV